MAVDDIPHPADMGPAPSRSRSSGPTPPHSLEAERECLAAPLVDPDAFESIASLLTLGDWYSDRHRELFRAMLELRRRETPIDPVTLKQQLVEAGQLERIGGPRSISELLDRAGTCANVEHYARTVRRLKLRRDAIDAARRLEVAAYDLDDDEAFMARFAGVADAQSRCLDDATPRSSWAQVTHDNVLDITEPERPSGSVVPTGIPELDEHIGGGLRGGWLTLLMAPPGAGKTSFALGNVARATLATGGTVLYVSTEMTRRRLNMRLLAGESGIAMRALRKRDLTSLQHSDLARAADIVASWDLHVDRLQTVDQIAAKARAMKRRGRLDLVVVDYVQRIRNGLPNPPADLAKTSQVLQDLAIDEDLPVLELSQPSTESRRHKGRLSAADAKGSGALEEDADLMLCLLRGEGDRDAAGIEVLKGRDVPDHVWPAEDMDQGKGKPPLKACGWRFNGERMRIEVT